MNNSLIINTKTKKIWFCPELRDGKRGRVFTKHYTNLTLTLDPNRFALFSYLIWVAGADNCFTYSALILRQYGEAIKSAEVRYGQSTLFTSEPKSRENLVWLIENGLLFPAGKELMINPSFTYVRLYVRGGFYKEWVRGYNEVVVLGGLLLLIEQFKQHVSLNVKNRK